MKKYKIYAGLGGGFGGAYYQYTTPEEVSEESAMEFAFEDACEIYDSYMGLHGIPDWEDIEQEAAELLGEDYSNEELSETINEIYREGREEWLDYYVKEDNGEED